MFLGVVLITFLCISQFLRLGSLHDIQLDDQRDFSVMDNAMNLMGMEPGEKNAIYTIIAGLLHLGNIGFEDSPDDMKGENQSMPAATVGCGVGLAQLGLVMKLQTQLAVLSCRGGKTAEKMEKYGSTRKFFSVSACLLEMLTTPQIALFQLIV